MAFTKKELKDYAILGGLAGALSFVLLWILAKIVTPFSITMSTFADRSIQLKPTVGTGIFEWLSNFIKIPAPTNMWGDLIKLVISGAVIVVLGGIAYDKISAVRIGKTPFGKTFNVLFLGSLIATAIITFGAWALSIPVLIALIVDSLIISLVLSKIARKYIPA